MPVELVLDTFFTLCETFLPISNGHSHSPADAKLALTFLLINLSFIGHLLIIAVGNLLHCAVLPLIGCPCLLLFYLLKLMQFDMRVFQQCSIICCSFKDFLGTFLPFNCVLRLSLAVKIHTVFSHKIPSIVFIKISLETRKSNI